MAVKNISIMEDVYRLLLARKKASESFSDVIRRTVKEKRDIMQFAGAWKNIPDKEIEEMKNDIKELKKRTTKNLLEKVKRMHDWS